MELNAILKTLPPEVAFALGRVATAHENRVHYRKRVKEAEGRLEEAQKNVRAFGCFEDCGDSYQSSLDRAEGFNESAVDLKISVERFYKKLKHEFLDRFPEHRDALEALFPGSTANQD